MKTEIIKAIAGFIIASITIVGAIFAIERYFAKSEEVVSLKNTDQLINERLDISIIDDQIYQLEQQISKIKDWNQFEQKAPVPELTPIEKEILDKTEQKLKELKEEKISRQKAYEDMRKK